MNTFFLFFIINFCPILFQILNDTGTIFPISLEMFWQDSTLSILERMTKNDNFRFNSVAFYRLGTEYNTTNYVYICISSVIATAAFWRTFYHDGKISPGW